MSVEPVKFLEIAEALRVSTEEIYLRTAINRAYYFTLHRAREVTPEDCFGDDPGMGSHERVIRAVERLGAAHRPGRARARELARALRRLRDARRIADYDLQEALSTAFVEDVVLRAKHTAVFCDDIARQIASSGAQE